MKVSLIVPSYNREELLVQTLKCALSQDYKNLEIIVVDQTKDHNEATQSYLNSIKPKIQYLFQETPGIAKARNTGVFNSSGEIIVMVDDDTYFSEDFISRHVEAHRHGDVIQGRIFQEGLQESKSPTWIELKYYKIRNNNNCPIDSKKINDVTGCNFSFKRYVFDKVGGFDENYTQVAIHEESDFAFRAWKVGVPFFYSSKASLEHFASPSGGVDSGIKNKLVDVAYYRNILYFSKKHYSSKASFSLKTRMLLRGVKELWKIIKLADRQSDDLIQR